MNKKIEHLYNPKGDHFVWWIYDGKKVEKNYAYSVLTEKIRGDDGIVIVEPSSINDPDNAVIYNPDGTLRARVINPVKDKGSKCFADVYYVNDELTLIAAGGRVFYACAIDEDGNVLRVYETR